MTGAAVLVVAAHVLGGRLWEQAVPGWARQFSLWTGSAVGGVFVLWNLFPMVVDARRSGSPNQPGRSPGLRQQLPCTALRYRSGWWSACTAGSAG